MLSEHMSFRHTILSFGILGWEFLVVKFQSRKTGTENLGTKELVPHIGFYLNPSEHPEEWIEHVKKICNNEGETC